MYVTGIVAEYNPFHNGHLYQLNQSKERTRSDFVIAVMSGNFTQRGTPSIINKFVRTQMALSSGIDMVLELPVPFASASAERFCEAAVSTFNKTGIVNVLSFGSEIGDIDLLKQLAQVLANEPPRLSQLIKNYLSKGYSFPRARQAALLEFFADEYPNQTLLNGIKEAVASPNNILGIEYIKALLKYNSPITPLTIKRQTAHYHDTEIYASIASATAIRTQMHSNRLDIIKQCMPEKSYQLLLAHTQHIPTFEDLNDFLHYKFIFSHKSDLYSLWDIPNDMIHSLFKQYTQNLSLTELVDTVTSKTYTRSAVQRALFRILLDISEADMLKLKDLDWIPYIRVLGCKKESTILLSELTKHSLVPVITNLKAAYSSLSEAGKILLDYELKASSIYNYITKNKTAYAQDFTHPFIKL